MFKNLIVYRISPTSPMDLSLLQEALANQPFIECGATQEHSCGWVSARGEAHAPLAESVGGQWVLRFVTESRVLPASVVARRVQEKAARIEQHSGRKPGKRQLRELKDEARLDLLPMAFTKQGGHWVWIDPGARLLMIDSASQAVADQITSALVASLSGWSLALLNTQTSPAQAMATWLREQQAPGRFSIARECELKSPDASKAAVRYARHSLAIEEVRQHIDAGKLPTRLALDWDDRLSLVLTEGLQLRRIAFSDVVFEGQSEDNKGFDGDAAIATSELAQLLADLIAALGGESPGVHSALTEQAANVGAPF